MAVGCGGRSWVYLCHQCNPIHDFTMGPTVGVGEAECGAEAGCTLDFNVIPFTTLQDGLVSDGRVGEEAEEGCTFDFKVIPFITL